MLLRARITDLWWSRRPLLAISHSHSLCTKIEFSSLSVAKVPQTLEEDRDDDFLPWLEDKAGVGISSVLSVVKSAHGRSLSASRAIRYGDCILKVPFDMQLSPDNLPSEITDGLSEEVGSIAKLALVILLEQTRSRDSEWVQYISRLPQLEEMHNTIFWSEVELQMVCKSSVYQEAIDKKYEIEKEYWVIKPALESFSENFGSTTYDDFMHAYALVSSRAWGSTKGYSLIPFADFLNHDGVSKAVVLNDEDKQVSKVIADRNYAPGEQFLIRYGKFSNATLMLDFGFALPDNIHDQVQIQVSIAEDDPLWKIKLELLHKSRKPTVKHASCFNSSVNTFIIKEVHSASGKGRGIPQSLRAFARILCCVSHQELNDLTVEAANNDGRLARRPFKNVSKEIEAHKTLLSVITQLIGEYLASIKSLECVNSPFGCEKFPGRRKMAQYLLTGELRVLKSASAWLENYCESLTTKGLSSV